MAVQAQYPSNVLLFNRNEQKRENMEFSLQFQAEEFLDQSNNFFTHGGVSNGREKKRGRTQQEEEAAVNPPLHTLMNLPQVHSSQTTLGLGLSFEGQNHQHQQKHQQGQDGQPLASTSPLLSAFLTQELAGQINQQKDEIDQFLRAQGDHLRRTFAESGKRHYHTLLGLSGESAARRLREKEVEVEKVARRNAELEVSIARLRAELMAWQEKARAKEAAVVSLQAQLQQVVGAALPQQQDRGVEPGCAAESAAAGAEDAESAYVDPERRRGDAARVGPAVCRACWGRAVSVVLLPCRHLCLCRECARTVQACPVCPCVRRGCVEVYLS